MDKFKTVKQMVAALLGRKMKQAEIARQADVSAATLTKLLQDRQDDVCYQVGKRIEQLEAKTRRIKK